MENKSTEKQPVRMPEVEKMARTYGIKIIRYIYLHNNPDVDSDLNSLMHDIAKEVKVQRVEK